MSQTLSATTPAHGADVRSAATLPDADYQASERTLAKAFRRILPFIFACYVISYLDRTNVGFAALTMNKDIGLTAEQFGFGAGLSFIGYFLFEIPSNLIMQKVGARIWIARIMITWGIFSMATAFVVGPKSFAAARFLLGLAEAGFTPGIYLYFTHWFPGKWRAKVTAAFLVGIPVANMIGSPFSGALLELGGLHGLRSWQWLLLIEGLPAVLLGIACLFVLADRPEKAKWLTDDEKAVLARRLAMEQRAIASKHGTTLRDAMTNWRVFVLAFINFCGIVGSIGVGLWMPQIIKQFGVEHAVVGWLTAIPYAMGAVVMLMAFYTKHTIPEVTFHIGEFKLPLYMLIAYLFLMVVGAMSGFFVVPMNALLQHRGHVLLSAGHSIAVQNFNENVSVLLMLCLYALLIKLNVPVSIVIVSFGIFVCITMALVMRRHRINEKLFHTAALIGEDKHH